VITVMNIWTSKALGISLLNEELFSCEEGLFQKVGSLLKTALEKACTSDSVVLRELP
jgi:hypothetical protein